MLQSMTGYGKGIANSADAQILVEIRAVNSKYLDIRLKLPIHYKEKELEIRKLISEQIHRGKIEVNLTIHGSSGSEEFDLDLGLIKRYFRELRDLTKELDVNHADLLGSVLRLPNILIPSEQTVEEEEWKQVSRLFGEVIQNFRSYRKTEGIALEKDIRTRLKNILVLLEEIDPHEEDRKKALENRLKKHINEYLGSTTTDPNRMEQEILYYLEKLDITEEKVRLAQHCEYFFEQLDLEEEVKGRKLNFISQEMGREINTMGAKAQYSEIQRLVVKMKDELEKIKEQLANAV
jgi:uncharacterized protein (TIGR00255 family)